MGVKGVDGFSHACWREGEKVKGAHESSKYYS
jgi:hypothetical protein